jgi:hypothetical protein
MENQSMKRTTKLYSELASRIAARQNAQNKAWYFRHDDVIDQLCDLLEDGSITIEDVLPSTDYRFCLRGLIFCGEQRTGMVFYLTCSASLVYEFTVKITGYARHSHGEYLADVLWAKLDSTITVTSTDDEDIIEESNVQSTD